ncbi:hypothetical protein D3C76_1616330 [compost metagenome]
MRVFQCNALSRWQIIRNPQFIPVTDHVAQNAIDHTRDSLVTQFLRQIDGFTDNSMFRNPIQIQHLVDADPQETSYPWLELGHSFGYKTFQEIIKRV